MTKSTITRERIQRIIRTIDSEAYDEEEIREWLSSDEIMELSRMALAAMDSEPVAYTDEEELNFVNDMACMWTKGMGINEVPLYRHAQPAPERDQVRIAHAEWSQATFGNVGPVGPLKHLSKEALEAAAEPGDLSEWADMQFLLWDAQRRAGITDDDITQAMLEKLAVNKQREWPEPKDGEPRLHIKAQPAPEYPETLPCPVLLEPGMRFGKGVKTKLVLEGIQRRAERYAELEAMTPEQRAEYDAGIEAFKAMLPQPAPIVPDEMLCEFYEVSNWPDLVRELVKHVEQLQDAAKRNVKPWEDTFPETLLPAYIDRIKQADDACRAAMLQAEPVTTANKLGNSPVIPDTWIPVSERMPENDVSVLTFNGMYKRVHHAMYGHWQCWEPGRITHWMPLPASPQEVKP